jgi:hypothetical protein
MKHRKWLVYVEKTGMILAERSSKKEAKKFILDNHLCDVNIKPEKFFF